MRPTSRNAKFGQAYRDRKVADNWITISGPLAVRLRVRAFNEGISVRALIRKILHRWAEEQSA